MSDSLAKYVILFVLSFNCQGSADLPQEQERRRQQIAIDFRYPESPETIKIENPYKVKSTAGKVLDVTGRGLEKVLVERLDSTWRRRLDATLTDSKGFFFLPGSSNEVQYLKISKPGFNTQLIKVIIKKNLKSQLNLTLGASQ